MNLKQGIISVKEYALKFHQLSRYAPDLVDDIKVRMRKFSSGLNLAFVLENKTILFIKDTNISRLIVYIQ